MVLSSRKKIRRDPPMVRPLQRSDDRHRHGEFPSKTRSLQFAGRTIPSRVQKGGTATVPSPSLQVQHMNGMLRGQFFAAHWADSPFPKCLATGAWEHGIHSASLTRVWEQACHVCPDLPNTGSTESVPTASGHHLEVGEHHPAPWWPHEHTGRVRLRDRGNTTHLSGERLKADGAL